MIIKFSVRCLGLAGVSLAVTGATPADPSAAQEPGELFRDCNVCPQMVVVPAGSFLMGSREDSEEEPHT